MMVKNRFRMISALLVCVGLIIFMSFIRYLQVRPAASPGRLVFTDYAKPNYRYTVDIFDLAHSTRSSLTREAFQDVGTQAVIDENHIYFSACFAQNNPMFCSAYVSEVIAPEEIHKFDRVKQFWKENYESPIWSPDAKHIAFGILNKGTQNNPLYSFNIHVMNADGTNALDIVPNENDNGFYFSWSPNSQQIAFACGDENILCIVNVDGKNLQKISAPHNTKVRDMAWSPDGNQIVFSVFAKDFQNAELYLVNADGSSLHRLLKTVVHSYDNLVWSPDGSKIAFRSDEPPRGIGEIYVIKPDGSDLRDLSLSLLDGNELGAVWSPDSNKIAFFSNQDSNDMFLYIVDADGGNLTKITDNSTWDATDTPAPELFWIP